MGESGRLTGQPTLPPDVMRALQDRFRVSGLRTVETLRALAAQLTRSPTASDVVDAVRRELHRVHGTAGTYGYHEASRLAGKLEERALRWADDATLDCVIRGAMIDQFAGVLELAFGVATPPNAAHPEPGAPPPPRAAARSVDTIGGAATPERDGTPDAEAEAVLTASFASDGTVATKPWPRRRSEAVTPVDDTPDVVVVEDDASLADMVVYALRSAGHHVQAYSSGPEALAALLALQPPTGKRPLVLIDVDLPGLDGHSLHERLRVERPGAFAVVFQTVHAGEVEQIRALRAGALDYVIKPLNLRVLLAKLPIWLRQIPDQG